MLIHVKICFKYFSCMFKGIGMGTGMGKGTKYGIRKTTKFGGNSCARILLLSVCGFKFAGSLRSVVLSSSIGDLTSGVNGFSRIASNGVLSGSMAGLTTSSLGFSLCKLGFFNGLSDRFKAKNCDCRM